MFTELSNTMGKATISLVIVKTGDNELTVSITPKSEGCNIAPGVVVGSPQELDAKFADAISGLIQDTEVMIIKNRAAKESMKKKEENKVVAKKAEPAKPSLTLVPKVEEEAPNQEPIKTEADTKPEPVKEETKVESVKVEETATSEPVKQHAPLEFSLDLF